MNKQILNMLIAGKQKQDTHFVFGGKLDGIVFENDLYPAFKSPNLGAIIQPLHATTGAKERICKLLYFYGGFKSWPVFLQQMTKQLKPTPFEAPSFDVVKEDKRQAITIHFPIKDEFRHRLGASEWVGWCVADDLDSMNRFFYEEKKD